MPIIVIYYKSIWNKSMKSVILIKSESAILHIFPSPGAKGVPEAQNQNIPIIDEIAICDVSIDGWGIWCKVL